MSAIAHSQFLTLPAEIRTQIYNYFFQPLVQYAEHKAQLVREDAARALDADIRITSLSSLQNPSRRVSQQDDVDVKQFLQILLVCRLIHQEVFPICYNNVTFYVRKPLDFANNFLRTLGLHKLSQIRHLEMRLDGIPVGVNGWSLSAPKPSYWNHHQIRMLFETYPELEYLDTLVITIEKFADKRLARHTNLMPPYGLPQTWLAESAWSQNKDTDAMKSGLSHWKLGQSSQSFRRAFTVTDDYKIDKKDMRFLRTADGRYCCEIDMKRIFIFTLWKTLDF